MKIYGNTSKCMKIHENSWFTYIYTCFRCLDLYFGCLVLYFGCLVLYWTIVWWPSPSLQPTHKNWAGQSAADQVQEALVITRTARSPTAKISLGTDSHYPSSRPRTGDMGNIRNIVENYMKICEAITADPMNMCWKQALRYCNKSMF